MQVGVPRDRFGDGAQMLHDELVVLEDALAAADAEVDGGYVEVGFHVNCVGK